MNEISIWEY